MPAARLRNVQDARRLTAGIAGDLDRGLFDPDYSNLEIRGEIDELHARIAADHHAGKLCEVPLSALLSDEARALGEHLDSIWDMMHGVR